MSDSNESIHLSQSLTMDLDLSSDILSHSSISTPVKSRNISLNQSLSALQALMESSDSEVEPDAIDEQDFIIPQVNNSQICEDSSLFDVDIAENIVKLTDDPNSIKEISETIVRYWYDVTKFEEGRPAKELISKFEQFDANELNKAKVLNIFNQLDDIRTSIKTEDSIFLFFVSALKVFQSVIDSKSTRNEPLEQSSKKLAEKSIESAAQIYGAKFVVFLSEAIKHEIGTPEFETNMREMKEIKNKLISKETQELKSIAVFLFKNIILYIDCAITNMIITDRMIASLNEFVLANTNLSYIENEIGESFNNFRQALLVVMANETILADKEAMESLVPAIPVNFIYFLLCILKPDESMTEFISYKKLEHFAQVNHCNFGMKVDEFLLRPKLLDLPELC